MFERLLQLMHLISNLGDSVFGVQAQTLSELAKGRGDGIRGFRSVMTKSLNLQMPNSRNPEVCHADVGAGLGICIPIVSVSEQGQDVRFHVGR